MFLFFPNDFIREHNPKIGEKYYIHGNDSKLFETTLLKTRNYANVKVHYFKGKTIYHRYIKRYYTSDHYLVFLTVPEAITQITTSANVVDNPVYRLKPKGELECMIRIHREIALKQFKKVMKLSTLAFCSLPTIQIPLAYELEKEDVLVINIGKPMVSQEWPMTPSFL